MSRFINLFFVITVLCGCTTGVKMVENDYSSLLHDGNSKVWMIRNLKSNGSDFAKKGDIRDLLIFYSNGTCVLQSTHEMGSQTGQKAEFKANFSKKTLVISFQKEKWEFNVEIKSEDEIVLNPISGSSTNFSLTLIPLPLLVK
jgi:hypothetical protein